MNGKSKNKISVILPVRNEAKIIENCIESLLKQKLNNIEIEILAIDGSSDDGTDKIVKELENRDNRIKYLFNEKIKTPFAFNKGINKSSGNYIAILGAHCEYEQNYLQTCFDELNKNDAIGCSGLINTKSLDNSFESFLSLCILKSTFGVSSNSFRTIKAGYAHSIPYGVFNKKIIEKIGGYNEQLHRNQDNDLNQRLIAAGHKLFITDKTFGNYTIDYDLKSLYLYAFNNGVWNGKTLFINRDAMKLYHFVPAFFVLYVASLITINIIGRFFISIELIFLCHLPIMIYFVIGLYETFKAFKQKSVIYISALPFIFFKFHSYYGLGTLKEIVKNLYLKLSLSKINI